MLRYPAIFSILFLSAAVLIAQDTGVITGKVVDVQTGEPLIGVNVLVLDSEQSRSGAVRVLIAPTLHPCRGRGTGLRAGPVRTHSGPIGTDPDLRGRIRPITTNNGPSRPAGTAIAA